MRDVGLGNKVYSPDLQTFELEGPTGIFGTLASVVVGPIRLLLRVMHNIVILPAALLESYASGLLIVSVILLVTGIVDIIVFKKWPLLVSQIPAVLLAVRLKQKASRGVQLAKAKVEVEIDDEQINELCNGIYDKLDAAIGIEEEK